MREEATRTQRKESSAWDSQQELCASVSSTTRALERGIPENYTSAWSPPPGLSSSRAPDWPNPSGSSRHR